MKPSWLAFVLSAGISSVLGCGNGSGTADAKSDAVADIAGDASIDGPIIPDVGPLPSGDAGGPVSGMQDMHCVADGNQVVQSTSQASCHPDAGDAGAPTTDYGDTMYNTSGSDDDCKYNVSWTSTPIYENFNVYFTVTATVRASANAPLAGANTIAEVFLNDTHPAPNTPQMTAENPPGTYVIGPIQFDAPGMWTVRFHFYEDCLDLLDDSPHGHAAFYVQVP